MCNQTASRHVVFIKTHKSASSTITVLLQRYGIANNKTFALPLPVGGHIFGDWVSVYNANMTAGYNESNANYTSWNGFDYIVNHARLNRPEMNKVVKDALYITILRDPITHLESSFGYFNIKKHFVKWTNDSRYESNPFRLFLSDPKFFHNELRYPHVRALQNWLWNGQLFDLGLDPGFFNNSDFINGAIHRLTTELDLVLIMEYFDESLILLKKLLCLGYQDIMYIPVNARRIDRKFTIEQELKPKIAAWNKGDVLLYERFNRTLWTKIDEYGPTFTHDLALFRDLKRNMTLECKTQKHSTTFPSVNCTGFGGWADPDNTEIIRKRQSRSDQ